MTTFRPRTLLIAGAMLLGIGSIALPALCQDRATTRSGAVVAMAMAERPLPVRIDPSARYLFILPNGAAQGSDAAEAEHVYDALERQGFRLVHERKATAVSMADGVKRLVDGGVQAQNISVMAMGDNVQTLIDVAQRVYNPKVNYIVVAGCKTPPSFASRVPMKGRILSLQLETATGMSPSCRPVFAGRGAATGFELEEITVRKDPSGQTSRIPELVLVEAINAWTRPRYEDDGVR